MESSSSKVLVGGSILPHNSTVPSVPQFQKLWYPLKCWLEVITHKWKRSMFHVVGHPRSNISFLPATLFTWPSCCCPLLSLLDKPSLALRVGVYILVQTHFRTEQKVALQFWQDQQVKQWLEAQRGNAHWGTVLYKVQWSVDLGNIIPFVASISVTKSNNCPPSLPPSQKCSGYLSQVRECVVLPLAQMWRLTFSTGMNSILGNNLSLIGAP